jgi:glycosyltransferase involved in cell wall biosynthesis
MDPQQNSKFTYTSIMTIDVALVYDVPGWAFHRMSLELARNAPRDWNFSTYATPKKHMLEEFHQFLSTKNQLIHYFSKYTPLFKNGVVSSTSVHSHPNPAERKFVNDSLHEREFFVISRELRDLYSAKFPDKSISVCHDGVETSTFYPRSAVSNSGALRLGWVGNSEWGNNDHKGFNRIFMPVVETLREEGLAIDVKIADPTKSNIPYALMPNFYDEIDVLLCTSLSEGTPMPILEAGAMKRAWISTRTGIVPEIAGPLQNAFIVDRSVPSFVEAVEKLSFNRQLMAACGKENHERIHESWGLQRSINSRIQFFADVLDRG